MFYVCQAFFKTFFRFFSFSFYWTLSVLVSLVSHSSVIISYLILTVKRFSQLFWNFLFHSLLSIRFCWFASQQLVYHITTVIALSSDFQNFFQRIFCRFCNHSAELFCLSPVPSQQLAYLITSDIIMSSVFKKFFEQFSSNFLSFLRGS